MESSCWDKKPPARSRLEVLGVGGVGEATRGGLFPVPFPSGDSWPEVTHHWMQFQGQGPRCPELWTTPAHSHCMPQTGAVDHASPQPLHAPDQHEKSADQQHLRLRLPCHPRSRPRPHIRDTILSETLSGLRWLWLRKEATATASRTMLSSRLAPRGRGVNTLGRGGCALTVPSSDLFD
uniref:Uncharacterized protein n=1 Tax=Macaca nemestrina TaxID=9545 RepID=A0A2K6E0N1_MACNE